jgi:hypothetical protein
VAVIMRQTMPAVASLEMLDAVTEEMGAKADPPAGLIVHTHYESGGQVEIMDVWESTQAYEKFAEDRLGPAMQAVAARRGVDIAQGGPPEYTVTDVHTVVRGR